MKILIRFSLVAIILLATKAFATIGVTNISQGCMANHRLFLKSDGNLWGLGQNYSGSLGDPAYDTLGQPRQIYFSNCVVVAVGASHSLMLKNDGSLWAMGGNVAGCLGDGTWTATNQPKLIIPDSVTTIATGAYHSLFVKSDGSLWAVGCNFSGQLGNGVFTSNPAQGNGISVPEKIVEKEVVAVAAGSDHSLFIKSDGSLWGMGYNQYGQLGDGTYAGFPNLGTNLPEQIVASGVVAAAAGATHSLFLKSDGSLWAMGYNFFGQLGNGNGRTTNLPTLIVASNVTAIACGRNHSLFTKSDGSLWAMGRNEYGQIGSGTSNLSVYEPEQIVASNVIAIAAGPDYSVFTKSDGTLWAMGNNSKGQLGDGFYGSMSDQTIIPEQVVPPPPPLLSSTISDNDLLISATCGFGGDFCLLTSTNLNLTVSEWTPILTNTIIYRYLSTFTATLTNALNSSSQQFYILQSQ